MHPVQTFQARYDMIATVLLPSINERLRLLRQRGREPPSLPSKPKQSSARSLMFPWAGQRALNAVSPPRFRLPYSGLMAQTRTSDVPFSVFDQSPCQARRLF